MNRTMIRDYLMSRNRIDGRNPYGSRGGYVTSRRGRRDRLMMDDMRMYNRGEGNIDLAEMTRQNQEIRHDPYMPRDYARSGRRDYGTGEPYAGVDDFYEQNDMARGRDMAGRRDYAYDYARNDYNRNDYARGDRARGSRDGHYPMVQGYMPIEAMGRFTGYYGMGEDYGMDYARGGRGRGNGRDYGMDYNYGYDYAEDYGENLTKEELEHWKKKLMQEVEEKDRQFFTKENILQRAKQMGVQMEEFTEDELILTTLMMYTDYCKTLGTSNMDLYIRLAKDWLMDKDVEMKGGEKLAVYHDCIVEGEDN